jgi:hypothetical protein
MMKIVENRLAKDLGTYAGTEAAAAWRRLTIAAVVTLAIVLLSIAMVTWLARGITRSIGAVAARRPAWRSEPTAPRMWAAWTRCARPRCPEAHQHQKGDRSASFWTPSFRSLLGQMGVQRNRVQLIAFSAGHAEIEATYLVPPVTPIASLAEVDRPGVWIASTAQAAYDLCLRGTFVRPP